MRKYFPLEIQNMHVSLASHPTVDCIALNKSLDQAVASMEINGGHDVFLRKIGKRWKIISSEVSWYE